MPAFRDLSGMRFGRLVVLSRAGKLGRMTAWLCKCDCGASNAVVGASLSAGSTKSCGCLRFDTKNNLRHGMTRTPTYRTWMNMRNRCAGNMPDALRYVESGITVCNRWGVFENFLTDMGARPAGASIDRLDNARGYEPGNCRWATPKQQSRNRSFNVLITFRGETRCASEWAELLGLSAKRVQQRVRCGWTRPEDILSAGTLKRRMSYHRAEA